jgi:hypothetical protein
MNIWPQNSQWSVREEMDSGNEAEDERLGRFGHSSVVHTAGASPKDVKSSPSHAESSHDILRRCADISDGADPLGLMLCSRMEKDREADVARLRQAEQRLSAGAAVDFQERRGRTPEPALAAAPRHGGARCARSCANHRTAP